MAGLYMLHKLRELGFSAVGLETADDVGGTWYWNRYPGARCDIESMDYSLSFDADLEQEWEWSERYATQPEILRYLQHVADRFDLRRDIRFETTVERAEWQSDDERWQIRTTTGDVIFGRHYVMASGCLSVPKDIDIAGVNNFAGPTYSTGRWPHEGVDFAGQRVAVIGTGSSGIQAIPLIAEQADELTVFQRTANYSLPAGNRPLDPAAVADLKARYPDHRAEARASRAGVPRPQPTAGVQQVGVAERERLLEAQYADGGLLGFGSVFTDTSVDETSNEIVAEFVRNKVRSKVDDPVVAEMLAPRHFPIFTKRLCLDTNYYETFNNDHVHLVDLRDEPISTITETGIDTSDRSIEVDAIVFATGFDAMTGAIVAVDVRGRNGQQLRDAWAEGPQTYLGLCVPGFPNFFTITGPQSPSVLSNMAVSIEQHVEWIADCLVDLRDGGHTTIEATETARDGWNQHNNDCAALTLFNKADSWYVGANVPGKPRVVLPYIGGVGTYRQMCDQVRARDYLGFERRGPNGSTVNDGVVARLQPDVAAVLNIMAELGLPPIESLSPHEARGFMAASAEASPPGPAVGEIIDGTFPGADGNDLDYRLYRPATAGPHGAVAYFHGGGWVLGNATSDDALCRQLCNESGAVIISCDYRHAPEARFPAAVEDGIAAVRWIADNADALGASAKLAVAGWSAGANVAAVAAQHARDNGGPTLAGQVLITPVTDCDMTRASYVDNAEGFTLTAGLMRWFWDHYCDVADRTDPRASPLRAHDLANLPPATIVTCEFDPLRDEGGAYAQALAAAGNVVTHLPQRGQIHTSIGAVGMNLSGRAARTQIAHALAAAVG